MTSYSSEYPDVQVNPKIKDYLEEFYAISDTPDVHERYSQAFTEDATVVMASKVAKGRSEILALRKGMWEHVASRKHKPLKVFPYGPNSDEVMLYGTVVYGLKNGNTSGLDWAARAHFVEEGGSIKMDFYQVYLDTAAQKSSK